MKTVASFNHADIQIYKFGFAPFGKPRMFSHLYFVDGLLIDTGQSNMRRETMAAIDSLPVDQLFVTHYHEDHTGNLAAVQQRFNPPCYASALCIELMRSPPKISPAQWLTWGDRPPNTQLVAADREIATARYRFELIPIPGHAADMVGLYEATQGWFFSADLWVSSHIRYFVYNESMNGQIESLKRALRLDFDVLLCGHRPQFKGGKEKLRQKLQFLEDFYGQVATLHHAGHSARSVMAQMALKESWKIRLLSLGALSMLNMVKSVIRDENSHEQTT